MNENLYIDLHVLQTVPPSCVNRDDTGSPKTAIYGGVTRARVSSQAWKREMRLMFRDMLKPEQCGIRTKHLPEELAKRISALNSTAEADKLSAKILDLCGIGMDKDDKNKTKVLLFVSLKQLDTLAEIAVQNAWNVTSLEEEISRLFPDAKADKLAKKILKIIGVDTNKDEDTNFLAVHEKVDTLIRLMEQTDKGDDEAKKSLKKARDALNSEMETICKNALYENPAVDIALFGRMLAEAATLNYDAAAQVAHSISTHAVHNEYDYFTALDDCAPEDNMGAGHLGTVEFNSSTLYRYATVSVRELEKYLGTDTPVAVRCFVNAFILSMPTGKQHTFANRTLPDFVYVTARRDQPVNLCGAFEKPILAGKDGYVEPSIKALEAYAQKKVYQPFDLYPERAWAVGQYSISDGFAEVMSRSALLAEIENYVKDAMNSGVV